MFEPTQIIFAPTTRCNLWCSHCRVTRSDQELSIEDAVRLLESCVSHGVDRIGFSGGEPFLRSDFLVAVCNAAVEQGMYFDRIMTNGVWFSDETELREKLQPLFDAGFDGTFGISMDAYHNQDPQKLALFFKTIHSIWKRKDGTEIISVRSADDAAFLSAIETLAKLLGSQIKKLGEEIVGISDSTYAKNIQDGFDDGSGLYIPVQRVPYSAAASENAWNSARWFTDDFCEGPGNVFYVHANGTVAVCCGYANEDSKLIVGRITDSYETLFKSARTNDYISLVYEKGLAAKRQEMEADGFIFPGKTNDMCFFCDYMCHRA